MPAVSKAQQRFFGMVRATQKGEMENPSSEVAKVASSASMSDVKKFAKTKHKGLPEKKKVEEEAKRCKVGYYYCYTDKKCKKIPMGYYVGRGGYLSKDDDSSEETKNKNGNGNGNGNGSNGDGGGSGNGNGGAGGVSEEKTFAQRDKIMKRAKSLHKHLYKNLHKKDTSGDVNERIDYADSKQMKKYADEKKKHKEQDKRMKFGKFVKRAEEARDRLRPGEVKRYDKTKGKWVSNKD